jgi:hypothetical protein
VSFSGIASPSGLTEEQKPNGEGKKQGQARIYEDERQQQLLLELDAQKKQADGYGKQDAGDTTADPRGEKRSQDIERGGARTSGSEQWGRE